MTKDEIIRMAREADLLVTTPLPDDSVFVADIERFAALVAAAEREACAKVCEDEAEKWEGDDGPISTEARLCALHIRARGTND